MPLRGRVDLPDRNCFSLFIPAYMSLSDDLAVKNATVYPEEVSGGELVMDATRLVLDAPQPDYFG